MAQEAKHKTGNLFTIGGRDDARSGLFVNIPIPGGSTRKVLDRKTFDGAVEAANNSLRQAVDKILKEQGASKDD
jgi:hypothetical protein